MSKAILLIKIEYNEENKSSPFNVECSDIYGKDNPGGHDFVNASDAFKEAFNFLMGNMIHRVDSSVKS